MNMPSLPSIPAMPDLSALPPLPPAALAAPAGAAPAPTWKDRLSRAAFRGFEFLTDSHDAKFGRRLAVHEYPGREWPSVQDLGGQARGWKLSAYFIGPDYDLERNGFLAKLCEPGADWLIHPWLGPLYVRAHAWSVAESNDKGGFCAVAIDFVEGGETPQPTPDRLDAAIARVRVMQEAIAASFDLAPMGAGGLSGFIAAVQGKLEILRTAIALSTLPLTAVSQITNLIGGLKTDLAALVALPGAYASAFLRAAKLIGGAGGSTGHNGAALADTARPRIIARCCNAAMPRGAAAGSGAVSLADPVARQNLSAEQTLRGGLLVGAAAELALTEYRAEADRDAVLASVTAAFDALLPTLPDPAFEAVASARAAVMEALLAQDLRPAVSRDVKEALPSVLLAHWLGVEESALLARNAVRHPLFMRGRIHG
ncbi:MAG: DNA circularization N-terminal domain-containing protein [Azonexus sp.]|jgi:prophage DNA circulation protein|nr:DNA circularization N-terminal domain-containing protein [Azonexus sp.]